MGDTRFPRPFRSLTQYTDVRMVASMLGRGVLPEEGCLNDQDPQMLDDWRVIHPIALKYEHDAASSD